MMNNCPACGKTRKVIISMKDSIYECKSCGCLYGNPILGQSYKYVKSSMTATWTEEKPFDLLCLGSQGVVRRHGWYDPKSKRITQVG
jgi:hypothetical protein